MDAIINQMRADYKTAVEAETDLRKDGLDDVRFSVGDQWGNVRTDRLTENRPCLTINKIPQFVKSITNEERKARPAPKAIPVGDSDVEIADIYTGIMKYIYSSSQGDIAVDTACDNQVTNGWGYIRVTTEYCDNESFNQDIKIKRVKNPFSITCDPSAVEPDYSDMKYAFVIEDVSKDEFEKRYPKADITASYFDAEGASENIDIKPSNTVRLAEYWVVEEEKKKLYMYETPEGIQVLDKEIEGLKAKMEREVFDRKIKCYISNGYEILEERDWLGKYIPIIPVLGRDVDVDGKRYLYGLVRPMKDAQRMYNYWNSAATEMIALAPKAPFIIAEGQIKGYEDMWQNANIKNYSALTYVPTALGGKAVPPPQRNVNEQPIQAISFAISQAAEDMKATTGIYDASLGNKSNETSGKAIMARQKEGALANYDFIDNLNRSIRHLGRIMIDLIPKIYDAPRVIRIIEENGGEKQVKINQPFETENGVMKLYDLSVGKYDVIAEVGSGSPTKRSEEREELAFLMQTNPDLMQVAGDLYFDLFDAPYAKEIAKRIRGTDKEEKEISPEVKAEMDKMAEMIKQLTIELNQAQDEMHLKDMDLQSKERIAAMNNQTSIVIEEMKNNFGAFAEEMKHLQAYLKVQMKEKPMQELPSIDSQNNSDTMGGMNAVE